MAVRVSFRRGNDVAVERSSGTCSNTKKATCTWTVRGGKTSSSNWRKTASFSEFGKDRTKSESHRVVCSICRAEYQLDDQIIIGKDCFHLFHKACALKWLVDRNYSCPFCGKVMVSEEEMVQVVPEVLCEKRIKELRGCGDGKVDDLDQTAQDSLPDQLW